jgi:alkylation response protein AidB-like acyl-CoA dehydrogenase
MQPVLTQVPPKSLRSTSATVMPAAVRRPASGGPAWPAPMMMASVLRMAVILGKGEPRRRRHAAGGGGAAQLFTETATGTPLVSTSNTAERARDCSTISCSFSGEASPLIEKLARMPS